MKNYTVLLFDKDDFIVVRFRDIPAWSREQAIMEVIGKRKLPKWETWDAIEKSNIQPSLFPHEDADDCQSWQRIDLP